MCETILLEIKGMHCPDCPAKVERSLSKLDGVNQIKVNLESEKGYVTYNKSLISITDIVNKINGLGFEANIQENVR